MGRQEGGAGQKLMKPQENLIDQLEDALAHSDIGRRAETLRRVTDLFVSGSGRFSGEQIALFDDVMCRLLEQIEVSARAAFGKRLAMIPDAPLRVIRGLALDDEIEVAGPVLAHSERLDDPILVESARTKSQNHLLAISRRKTLAEAVTDVLVERGNKQVVLSTANNRGARFSEASFCRLIKRSDGDDTLAACVGSRPDIPQPLLLVLLETASELV